MEKGLEDSEFDARDGRILKGDEMRRLCKVLANIEDSLLVLERRGVPLRIHAERQDPETGRLPVYHVFLGTEDHWITGRKRLDDFIKKHGGNNMEVDTEAGATDDAARTQHECDGLGSGGSRHLLAPNEGWAVDGTSRREICRVVLVDGSSVA